MNFQEDRLFLWKYFRMSFQKGPLFPSRSIVRMRSGLRGLWSHPELITDQNDSQYGPQHGQHEPLFPNDSAWVFFKDIVVINLPFTRK